MLDVQLVQGAWREEKSRVATGYLPWPTASGPKLVEGGVAPDWTEHKCRTWSGTPFHFLHWLCRRGHCGEIFIMQVYCFFVLGHFWDTCKYEHWIKCKKKQQQKNNNTSAPVFLFTDDHRHSGMEISFQVHKDSLGQIINVSLQIWITVTSRDFITNLSWRLIKSFFTYLAIYSIVIWDLRGKWTWNQ